MFHVRAARWLPFVFAAALMYGALLEGQTLGMPAPTSGDCATTATGAVLCTKTNGTAFAPSATTDTTNAANIASGTLNSARLPVIPVANLQPLVMDTTGLLGLYRFDETGGNLLDYSGNGNNGTVTGTLTRTGTSYSYPPLSSTPSVDFPAALNGTNTYYFVVTAAATPGGVNAAGANNNIVFLTNTAASGASNLQIFGQNPKAGPFYPTSLLPGTYALEYGVTSGYGTSVNTGDAWAGTHVIALSCPSSGAGSFYLDGVPLTNQSGSTACYNVETTGNFRLGNSGSGNGLAPFGVTYWAAAFYSTSDSAATVAKRSGTLRNYAFSKGAPFLGAPAVPSMFAKVIGQGDSIMCGYGLTDNKCLGAVAPGTSVQSYMALLAAQLNNAYTVVNYGVPSAWVQDNIAAAPSLVDPQALSSLGQNFAVLSAGTNNFNSATTYAAVWGMQQAWASARAQAGFRPVLIGITSRTGTNCNGSQNCDTVVQAMDAVQRSGWKGSKFAGYVDLGSDPLLGATGAYSNQVSSSSNCTGGAAQMFFTDGLHLCGGHTEIAKALACVLNGVDGSNASNMNAAALTASATLSCADGGRIADPTNGAVTLSLWSAMWQTGREIGFCNVSSSTANAMLLNAPGDFPFSNVSGRTSVTVAPNSCVRFRATFNGNAAAPGNYWMQM